MRLNHEDARFEKSKDCLFNDQDFCPFTEKPVRSSSLEFSLCDANEEFVETKSPGHALSFLYLKWVVILFAMCALISFVISVQIAAGF